MDAIEDPVVGWQPDLRSEREPMSAPKAARPMRRVRARMRRMLPARYAGVVAGGLALLLAACAAVPAGIGKGTPLRGLLTVVATIGGFVLLFAASLPRRCGRRLRRAYTRLWPAALAFSLLCAAGTVLTLDGAVDYTLAAPPSQTYQSDVLAFSDADARLVLAGHNPYTSDASFWPVAGRFPQAQMTPLRLGELANAEDYPPLQWLRHAAQRAAADPAARTPIFNPGTLHSYPALSFLLDVPLLAAGIANVLVLNLLVYGALFGWLVWQAPVGWRHWAALAAASGLITAGASLFMDTEVICVAFILLAWHYRQRVVLSAVLLGLGCAFKQYVWFFAPFLLLEVWLRGGWRPAARYAAVAAGAFLLPNVPYIAASPAAWWASLWLPMADRLFPTGMGLIALSTSHLLPYGPQQLYAALEGAALVCTLVYFARHRTQIGDAALLLALVPLFFAFRSLAPYFGFMPWLALYAANRLYASRRAYLPQESRLAGGVMAGAAALAQHLGFTGFTRSHTSAL